MRNVGESRKETFMRISALRYGTKPKPTCGGKRKRGRPRGIRRRTVESKGAELGLTSWAAAAAVTKNRDKMSDQYPLPVGKEVR